MLHVAVRNGEQYEECQKLKEKSNPQKPETSQSKAVSYAH